MWTRYLDSRLDNFICGRCNLISWLYPDWTWLISPWKHVADYLIATVTAVTGRYIVSILQLRETNTGSLEQWRTSADATACQLLENTNAITTIV